MLLIKLKLVEFTNRKPLPSFGTSEKQICVYFKMERNMIVATAFPCRHRTVQLPCAVHVHGTVCAHEPVCILLLIHIYTLNKSTHNSSFGFTLNVILCVCYPSIDEKRIKRRLTFSERSQKRLKSWTTHKTAYILKRIFEIAFNLKKIV